MMRRVKPIVKKKPIDEFAGDVARMIKFRIVVAVLMLEQIDRHDSPLAEEPRNAKVNKRRPPIQKQQCQKKQNHRDPLALNPPKKLRLLLAPMRNIRRFILMHQSDNHKWKCEEVKPV